MPCDSFRCPRVTGVKGPIERAPNTTEQPVPASGRASQDNAQIRPNLRKVPLVTIQETLGQADQRYLSTNSGGVNQVKMRPARRSERAVCRSASWWDTLFHAAT